MLHNGTNPQSGGVRTDTNLQFLRKYLQADVIALKNKPFRKVYIDAFAGSGLAG